MRALLKGTQYARIGAESTGPIPAKELLGVVELAAKTGSEVCDF